MSNLSRPLRSAAGILATACLLALAGCYTLNYENVPVRMYAGRALTARQVRHAIVHAADAAGWSLQQNKPGVFYATRIHADQKAVIELKYSARYFSIIYVRSQNLVVGPKKTPASFRRPPGLGAVFMQEDINPQSGPRARYADWALHLKYGIERALGGRPTVGG